MALFALFSPLALRFLGNAGACRRGGRRPSVEAIINHVHICDIHWADDQLTEAQARYPGRVLKQIHEFKLRADFPDRRFIVGFNDEPNVDLGDYQFTFWPER